MMRARTARGGRVLLTLVTLIALAWGTIGISAPADAQATNECVNPAWSPSEVYVGGDQVSHNDGEWRAQWWTLGEEPGTTGVWGVWEHLGSCDGSGDDEEDQPPATPTGLGITATTSTSVSLSWDASAGADSYVVTRNGQQAGTTSATSFTDSGLSPSTSYSYTVRARNAAGESAASAQVSATTQPPSQGKPGLPDHVLVGYLHASFLNGSGHMRMADVPDEWDIINLAFAEPTSPTSGQLQFELCPPSECPGGETEAEFIAAIRQKQAQGKKVLLSVGGANGQVRLETPAAANAFVQSASAIIDRFGLDGLDVDFEGQSLILNQGDRDFRNPTSPTIVNLISALRALADRYGDDFVLTMAPETFFVQLGYTFYGGSCLGCDRRAGAYLPVIHALRDELTLLHVQDYNSGPITGLDDQFHFMGNADFHVAMTDMVLAGFPIEGDANRFFPGLRQDQVAFGLPASPNAGNGFTPVAAVHQALDCLIKGVGCGSYQPQGVYPDMRGLMTWSINWDRFNGFEFSTNHRAYFDALP